MSYLLDTSVITRLGDTSVRTRLRSLGVDGVSRSAMTDLEIGFSARNGEEWDELLQALQAFPPVDITAGHFSRALQVQRLLADAGLRGRKVPDLLIAAVAEASGRAVLHYDRDYDHIAATTGQRAEWIVPRGSID